MDTLAEVRVSAAAAQLAAREYRAVVARAWQEAGEDGAGFSRSEVARQAGVTRQTAERWWREVYREDA